MSTSASFSRRQFYEADDDEERVTPATKRKHNDDDSRVKKESKKDADGSGSDDDSFTYVPLKKRREQEEAQLAAFKKGYTSYTTTNDPSSSSSSSSSFDALSQITNTNTSTQSLVDINLQLIKARGHVITEKEEQAAEEENLLKNLTGTCYIHSPHDTCNTHALFTYSIVVVCTSRHPHAMFVCMVD